MSTGGSPVSPYKGLNAFDDSELDALLFFGRERETEIVVANLIASRLTVLYGPSGVGKSSLLRAAVARSLRQLPEEPLVVVFSQWSADPATALSEIVAGAAGVESGTMLAVVEAAQSGRDVYLILDQAEEYFLYHADDAGPLSFAELLPSLLSTPLRVNLLVSLREDSLAKLDRFTGRISGLFANTLRLDRLDRAAGRAAIAKPVERFAELTGESIAVESELVDRVLDEVGAGRIEPALGGLGAVEEDVVGARIEAPYLQLVMQRLWDEERAAGSATLRVATLERLGGAQHIVEEHLEGAMAELGEDEKDIAARLFNHLVTPSGAKIAHEVADLADFGHVAAEVVTPVLDTLAERRILRALDEVGARRYEIFHDVLAQPVLAWRTRHRTERAIEQQLADSHRRRRRLQWLVAGVLVALALMTAVSVFALDQRREAKQQAEEAKARELEATAIAELDSDPELSLLLALEAASISPSPSAAETLRRALLDSRVRTVVDVGEPLQGAMVVGDAVILVTTDGDVVQADARTGEIGSTVDTGEHVTHVSFSADGTALLTGAKGELRLVRPSGRVVLVRTGGDAAGAQLAGDGTQAIVFGSGSARLIAVPNGEALRAFAHRGILSAAVSPIGRRVVTGGADDTVRIWSARSGGLIQRMGQEGNAAAVAYSPRGDLVSSASTDGLGRVWRVVNGRLAATLTGHGNYVSDVDFSTDGTQIVTASRDGTARVWRAETGAPLALLAGHSDRVTSADFVGGAGSSVVTASADGTARIWDVLVQPELLEVAQLERAVTRVDFVRDDVLRAVTEDGQVTLDPTTGRPVAISLPPFRSSRRVVGPDGRVATIRSNTVVLRGAGRQLVLGGHRDRVTSVAFSADGARVVTASRDHDARIWDASTGRFVRVLQGHFGAVNDARFSPDGRWVVTGGPRTAGLWDARSGELVVYLRGHRGTVTSATFDPTGRTILTAGVDGSVRSYRCRICGGLGELMELAQTRLAETGRELSDDERDRYLG